MKKVFWKVYGEDMGDEPTLFSDETLARETHSNMIAEYAQELGCPKAHKIAAERIKLVREERVVVGTQAPEDYDGFGTMTVGAGTFIRKPFRLAAVLPFAEEWQSMRYMSGLHGAIPAEQLDSVEFGV